MGNFALAQSPIHSPKVVHPSDTSDEGKSKDELRKELHELRSRMQELLAVGDGSNEFLDKRAMLPYSGWIGLEWAMGWTNEFMLSKAASMANVPPCSPTPEASTGKEQVF